MPRIVEVREGILKKNDVLARNLRTRFRDSGVFVTSLVSSPGAGKTALLQRTLEGFKETRRVGALVGDLATDRDAQRLGQTGVRVRQITTGTVCHLDAQMVEQALEGWDLGALDLLFIENVGNLVCPSSYDLGEHVRIVLLSVTEGEDKPLKYPTIFNTVGPRRDHQDRPRRRCGLRQGRGVPQHPRGAAGLEILEVSARTGTGMESWRNRLRELSGAESFRRALPQGQYSPASPTHL